MSSNNSLTAYLRATISKLYYREVDMADEVYFMHCSFGEFRIRWMVRETSDWLEGVEPAYVPTATPARLPEPEARPTLTDFGLYI